VQEERQEQDEFMLMLEREAERGRGGDVDAYGGDAGGEGAAGDAGEERAYGDTIYTDELGAVMGADRERSDQLDSWLGRAF
jgi:hypothetical protein